MILDLLLLYNILKELSVSLCIVSENTVDFNSVFFFHFWTVNILFIYSFTKGDNERHVAHWQRHACVLRGAGVRPYQCTLFFHFCFFMFCLLLFFHLCFFFHFYLFWLFFYLLIYFDVFFYFDLNCFFHLCFFLKKQFIDIFFLWLNFFQLLTQ